MDPLVVPSLRRAPSQPVWQTFLGTNSWAILGRGWAPRAPSLPVARYAPSILRSVGRVLTAQGFQDCDSPRRGAKHM